MKFDDYGITGKSYWQYVDELDGRGLNLSYPTSVVKAIKQLFYDIGDEGIQDAKNFILYIHRRDGGGIDTSYYDILSPSATFALKFFFKNRTMDLNYVPRCPRSDEIIKVLLESDKYTAMLIAIKRWGSVIFHNLKYGEYRMGIFNSAFLAHRFNNEIIDLLNEYLMNRIRLNTETKKWEFYYIKSNKAHLVSEKAVIGMVIYKITSDKNINLPENANEDYKMEKVYENYAINILPKDDNLRVPPSGSFLLDCKNIAKKIKDISFTKDVILTFQDLIMYGYYNDKIFSVDVISHISSIFGHRRWVQPFFLAISLYSGNKIDIPELTSSSEEVCKAVINPKTYKNYDLVIEAIKYLDSIYDTLVDREAVR